MATVNVGIVSEQPLTRLALALIMAASTFVWRRHSAENCAQNTR